MSDTLALLIAKQAKSSKDESESSEKSKAMPREHLVRKAKEAAAGRIIKAVKDEDASGLVMAMEMYEELCDEMEEEDSEDEE